jgi:hypothetical protein
VLLEWSHKVSHECKSDLFLNVGPTLPGRELPYVDYSICRVEVVQNEDKQTDI